MSERHHPNIEIPRAVCLLVSASTDCGRALSSMLGSQFLVERAETGIDRLKLGVAALQPSMVLFDFTSPQTQSASAMVQDARREWPKLPLLGVGLTTDPHATLAALRAGVDDFVDLAAESDDVLQVVRKFMAGAVIPTAVKGQIVMLLGARAGLGVSTIAGNLSILLRDQGLPDNPEVALLDMGLPARDGLLYMDVRSEFSFVDGVRNLRRMDHTLVQTTLPRQANGVAVLPLPATLSQMRDISHGDSVALVRRFRDFFQYQVADFGGFSNTEFMVQMLGIENPADRVWIVCDQSLGGIVSTTQMLADLRAGGVDTARFGLIVNRFDPKVDIAAQDIASRLGLKLEAVLPLRGPALLNACSRGEMLANVAPKDPFVQVLRGLAQRILPIADNGTQGAGGRSWVEKLARFAGK